MNKLSFLMLLLFSFNFVSTGFADERLMPTAKMVDFIEDADGLIRKENGKTIETAITHLSDYGIKTGREFVDEAGNSFLHHLCLYDYPELFETTHNLFKYFIKKGLNDYNFTNNGESLLHFAAMSGNGKIAELLLKKGALVDLREWHGQTPLILAASAKKGAAAMRVVLEGGADANATDCRDTSALHWVAFYGDVDSVRLLLEKGANPNKCSRENTTPLSNASQILDEEVRGRMVALLRRYGAREEVALHERPLHEDHMLDEYDRDTLRDLAYEYLRDYGEPINWDKVTKSFRAFQPLRWQNIGQRELVQKLQNELRDHFETGRRKDEWARYVKYKIVKPENPIEEPVATAEKPISKPSSEKKKARLKKKAERVSDEDDDDIFLADLEDDAPPPKKVKENAPKTKKDKAAAPPEKKKEKRVSSSDEGDNDDGEPIYSESGSNNNARKKKKDTGSLNFVIEIPLVEPGDIESEGEELRDPTAELPRAPQRSPVKKAAQQAVQDNDALIVKIMLANNDTNFMNVYQIAYEEGKPCINCRMGGNNMTIATAAAKMKRFELFRCLVAHPAFIRVLDVNEHGTTLRTRLTDELIREQCFTLLPELLQGDALSAQLLRAFETRQINKEAFRSLLGENNVNALATQRFLELATSEGNGDLIKFWLESEFVDWTGAGI